MLCLLGTHSGEAEVVIYEIMYRPASLNAEEEYIELANTGPEDADLSGWSFDRGIQYVFPSETVLKAGGFLIVSSSPSVFQKRSGDHQTFGPFDGRLNNNGETIQLTDSLGQLIDRVSYKDELGWPERANGLGPSIERIHPAMPPDYPHSWNAGPIGGTPGRINSSRIENPFPAIINVHQIPVVPTSTQETHIVCTILHAFPLRQVVLHYKTENENTFSQTTMFDDGNQGDGLMEDRKYAGTIPSFHSGTIVEFFIEAVGENDTIGRFPIEGSQRAAIYRVDDQQYETPLPLYRIVMRRKDEQNLRIRDIWSNDELDGSFVFGNDIFYNTGVRFRGKGSRHVEPKSYRVNFSQSRYFGTIRKLNLNAHEPDRQFIGLETFKLLRMPVPEKRMVSLVFNDAYVPNYIQVERTGREMMERIFGNDSGNLYRGAEQANLDYRGEDKNRYRSNYIKETNEFQDDYSDIIRLCDAFSNSSEEQFAEAVSEQINTRQWIRWFAIKQFLNDREGGLSRERGDDYYIYKNPRDDLFYLLPWDLDSVIVEPFEAIHHHGTPNVRRLLRNPDLARFYYQELLSLLDVEVPQELMDSIIERAAPLSSPSRMQYLKDTSRRLRAFHYANISRALSVSINVNDTIQLSGKAHAAKTCWVHVNGEPAEYIPWQAQWSSDQPLKDGRNPFHIEALAADTSVVESTRFIIYHNASPPEDGHETAGHEVWTKADSPIQLERNLIVPAEDSLTIKFGVIVQMAAGTSIVVFGILNVIGSESEPVRFEPLQPQTRWGNIIVAEAAGPVTISHTRFIDTQPVVFRQKYYVGGVTVHDSTATIENSVFANFSGRAIDTLNASMTIRSNTFHMESALPPSEGEGVYCTNSYAVVENNSFQHLKGYSDAIDFDYELDRPSIVRGNRIHGSEDDGIDLLSSSAIIENNKILHCADKGISLEGNSHPKVYNNVIYDANIGVAVKDQCRAELIHNTITDVTTGVSIYEKNMDAGGAEAVIINCVIWDTITSIDKDVKSNFTASYNDLMQLPGDAGTNFFLDPLFFNPAEKDFRLLPASPLINAGTKTSIPFDLLGISRLQGDSPDIGAYEMMQPTAIPEWFLY